MAKYYLIFYYYLVTHLLLQILLSNLNSNILTSTTILTTDYTIMTLFAGLPYYSIFYPMNVHLLTPILVSLRAQNFTDK